MSLDLQCSFGHLSVEDLGTRSYRGMVELACSGGEAAGVATAVSTQLAHSTTTPFTLTSACAGVSNFNLSQLIELQEWAEIAPAIVQRHSDLFTQDVVVQRFCLSQGIRYTAFSTLGGQYLGKGFTMSPVLHNGGVQAIADAHGLTPAQVCSALVSWSRLLCVHTRQLFSLWLG
jgi:hypothetical protein